jgi:type III restriction enzyme
MNTVGKPGRLGEHIRCVVSVSMLTEGWDANTVTHILGIRAFGTQLLCEQVVGRALRRASLRREQRRDVRARVRGGLRRPVQLPVRLGTGTVAGAKPVLTVKALPERAHLRIEFPRLLGYRYEMPTEHLDATLRRIGDPRSLDQDVPLTTELDPIVGQIAIHDLGRRAPMAVPPARADRPALDHDCVEPYLKDSAYPQMLLLTEYSHAAAERIYQGIVAGTPGREAD